MTRRRSTLQDLRRLSYRKVTTHEMHWLAGMLEGEGSFCHHPTRRFPTISFVSTDFDSTSKVASMLGGRVSSRTKLTAGRKIVWTVHISGTRAVEWMMTLYCLMGIRRRGRIKELLTDWRDNVSAKTLQRRKISHGRAIPA